MENKNTKIKKQRKPGTYSGRGTIKLTRDQINFILLGRCNGYSLRKVSQQFTLTFDLPTDHKFIERVSKTPHKYEKGYKKPKSEYKTYNIDA